MKNFKEWNNRKSKIHTDRSRVFFGEREIWFCYLGANIGFEQDGRGHDFLRPVLIVKKFNKEIFWAISLTKAKKNNQEHYFKFIFKNQQLSLAILSQLRIIDAKRLKYKTGVMSKKDFTALKTKIRQFLA